MLTGVVGRGIVRVHEKGWRAEFADIVGLSDEVLAFTHLDTDLGLIRRVGPRKAIDGGLAQVVADKYQLPVLPLEQLSEKMRGIGDFVPTNRGATDVDLGREMGTIEIQLKSADRH